MTDISLCMIVRNEQDWLERSVGSVRSIVSEVIIVDTGSTDSTIEIARTLNASVYSFPWCDDFSAARNYSLQLAQGEWILVLDADEIVAESQLEQLQKLCTDTQICFQLIQRSYTNEETQPRTLPCRGEYLELERHYHAYYDVAVVRLFPNNPCIQYGGRVHELVEHSIRKSEELRIESAPVVLHHYGNTPELQASKDKGALYARLAAEKLSDTPENLSALYEMGRVQLLKGRFEKSISFFRRALHINPQHPDSLLNLSHALIQVGKVDSAIALCQRGIEHFPHDAELIGNLAVAFSRRGSTRDAQAAYEKAVELSPNPARHLCNLGRFLTLQERIGEAVQCYERAIEGMPRSTTAKVNLALIHYQEHRTEQARNLLQEVIDESPDCGVAFYNLGIICRDLGEKLPAAQLLERYCELCEQQLGSIEGADRERLAALRAESLRLRSAAEV